MPKRIGFLYEKFLTLENFIQAEKIVGKNKKSKNLMAKHIYENAERYGKELFEKYRDGRFTYHKYKEITIVDTYKGKERRLKIPCLEDQAVMQAWLNVATPYIERRNYYYNCGSIPKAGQTRCVNAIKKWMRNKKIKYVAVLDIRKFYDTCPHQAVMDGLKRIFKDERFLGAAQDILQSMGSDGVGIAIGFPVSHWFANVALMELDHEGKRLFPKIKATRYMDDILYLSTNKRNLHRLVLWAKCFVFNVSMQLKKWQVRKLSAKEGFAFLSYRFFCKYTLLVKELMFRIIRRFEKAKNQMNVHIARGLISNLGILSHCDSYRFRQLFVYPWVNVANLNRMVSNYDKGLLCRKTCSC